MLLQPDRLEQARLGALHQLNLLDTPPSESFDRITRMASQIFQLPIAAVSLTDRDRQWFKSRIGVDHRSIPRYQAPCAQVAESADVFVIPDFAEDAGYADSLLGQSGIRFYAGAPLTTREGYGLGALCVLGTEPRTVSDVELAALRDLAAMVMAQIEMQHAFGRIDPLTGLPNRSQFLDNIADLAADEAGANRLAVLIDLARPEQISACARVLGPERVDTMVQDAALRLQQFLGPSRSVYHVAATQFAFLAPPDVDLDDYVALVASKQREASLGAVAGTHMTSSVGIAAIALGATEPRTILRALNSAAQDARFAPNAVSVYSSDADERHRRRYQLLQDFGDALAASDQLRLVYQPRVDLASGRCVGAEALLRWNHPLLGNVPPGEFIPIVEHSPHAQSLTDFVIEHALRQLRQWRGARHDLVLSVNVSAANLTETDFTSRVTAALERHRVDAEQLELEMTESAMMVDADRARRQLEALSARGVRLAIDDFGTGYSSLAYLQSLPVDVVKIDQSFIRHLDRGAKPAALVRSMITLSHDLGYRVVAEGIETAAAAALLREMNCDEAQGYFFAHPLEVEALDLWMGRETTGGPERATKRAPASVRRKKRAEPAG